MPAAKFSFPPHFLWGTTSSAHQVEGNNTNNDWYAWEKSGQIVDQTASGWACDWWGGRWAEDFDRAAETGQNAHRLSLEWSRIQPTANRWDENALDYYRQMVRGLKERGLTPMVTLHHFTTPLWVIETGGWENEQIVPRFAAFTRRVVEALKEYVSLWCTIHEPNQLATQGYFWGQFPPGKNNPKTTYTVLKNTLLAHAAAYEIIHEYQKDAQVGLAHHNRAWQPAHPNNFLDRWAAYRLNATCNLAIPNALQSGTLQAFARRTRLPQIQNTQDFFGINFHTSANVSFRIGARKTGFLKGAVPQNGDLSPGGFSVNAADEFFQALRRASQFRLPIYVTANGTEDPQDAFRRRYLAEHIRNLWRGVNFNWPIRGYFYHALTDQFEWAQGWSQQFGLWALNPETQTRTKRLSADFYAAICNEKALSSDMVQTYAPEVFQQLFP